MTVPRLVNRVTVKRPTADEAAVEVRRLRAFERLKRFGFDEQQAWVLARADHDVFFVPAEAVGL